MTEHSAFHCGVLDSKDAARVEFLTAEARAENAARGQYHSEAQIVSPIDDRIPWGAWIRIVWIVLLGAIRG
jgi:hypothetical protein